VVDVETTGLDSAIDRVISFGVVPVSRGRAEIGAAAYGLVNPGRELPERSIVIHGMLPEDLRDAPRAPEAFAPLAEAVRGRILVGHAAWVEHAFLRGPLRAHGVRLWRKPVDTAKLARVLAIDRSRHDPGYRSLAETAAELGLPCTASTMPWATP
jgi:DNA polymerase III subunit epsilon